MKFLKNVLIFFASMLLVAAAYAQEPAKELVTEGSVALDTGISAPPVPARARTNYLAAISYSPVDYPIPSKLGLTVGLVKSQYQTWELEYMRGSLSVPGGFRDLGSIHDIRAALIGRSFFGNSFHMSYGLSYFDFSATVGDSLASSLTNGVYPDIDAMTVQGVGFNIGLGNTWVLKRDITIGVDWLTWAQPLFVTKKSSDYVKYTTSENDKKNVEDTMTLISYLPRFTLVNIHVGMLF